MINGTEEHGCESKGRRALKMAVPGALHGSDSYEFGGKCLKADSETFHIHVPNKSNVQKSFPLL